MSKVPIIKGPVNLPGPLSGNFIGPEVAFLEAPVNFELSRYLPGAVTGGPKKYRAVTRLLRGHFTVVRGRRRTSWNSISFESFALCDRTVLLRFDSKDNAIVYVLSLTLRSSLFQSRATNSKLPVRM